MARMVNTVRGPVSSDDLGAVLAHEHFVFGFPGYQGDLSFSGFDKNAMLERFKTIFGRLREEYGVKTIVDATPNDCGRDVFLLREIAEACDLNIITSTGYYYELEGASGYWNYRNGNCKGDVTDEIYQLFKRELQEGVMGSDIKCGCIKVASSVGKISDYDMWLFKAAARIAREDPNVRIITHTASGTGADLQAEFFLSEGVNPAHVQIGHICGDRNVDNIRAIIDKGFYVAFDRIGLSGWGDTPTDEDRFANLIKLAESGHLKKVLISTDHIGQFLGRKVEFPDSFEDFLKNWNFTYIYDQVLPRLKELGMSADDIKQLTEKNPAAFYGGE